MKTLGRPAGDRARDGRGDVDGAVPDERVGRARLPAARARTARPGTPMPASSPTGVSSGVRATIAATRAPSVQAGHAAAWIGVGGKSAGPNGRDDVAPDRRRRAAEHADDGLRRDHAPGRDPVFLPLLQNVQVGERHRLAVLEMNRPPGRVARLGRRQADDRPDRPPRLAPDLEADRDRRVVERRRRDVQRLRLPLRAGRGRAGRSAARGGRSRQATRSRTAATSCRQLRPAPGGQRTLAADPIQAYAFDAASAA